MIKQQQRLTENNVIEILSSLNEDELEELFESLTEEELQELLEWGPLNLFRRAASSISRVGKNIAKRGGAKVFTPTSRTQALNRKVSRGAEKLAADRSNKRMQQAFKTEINRVPGVKPVLRAKKLNAFQQTKYHAGEKLKNVGAWAKANKGKLAGAALAGTASYAASKLSQRRQEQAARR
jgi:hypothetical protein